MENKTSHYWTAHCDKFSPFITGNVKCMKNRAALFICEAGETYSVIIEAQFEEKKGDKEMCAWVLEPLHL